jgi:hypothetical protein
MDTMNMYLLRVGTSKKLYPEIVHIFGIGHYKSKGLGEDDFSKKLIYFYKYGNEPDFFLEKLIDLFNLRFKGDTIQFDCIAVYPTRKKDTINPHMKALAENLSKSVGIPYKQIIRRNKDIKPNHELKTFEERAENVKGSIDITEDVAGKNIIILDNTTTTGISLIDAANLLLEKGARNVVCICLGLGYKNKDSDWNDLNKTLKYSRIKAICRSPFVPKEKRIPK